MSHLKLLTINWIQVGAIATPYTHAYTHNPPKMICRSCIRAASRVQTQITRSQQSQRHQYARFLSSTTPPLRNAAPISATTATQTAARQGDASSTHTPPTATSTSAAQPFSESLTPAASPDLKGVATEAAKKKTTPLVKSSMPAGQPLKGLNFLKDRQDPVALADDEYPAWLWTILDRQEKKAEAGAGDLFCMFLFFLLLRPHCSFPASLSLSLSLSQTTPQSLCNH